MEQNVGFHISVSGSRRMKSPSMPFSPCGFPTKPPKRANYTPIDMEPDVRGSLFKKTMVFQGPPEWKVPR